MKLIFQKELKKIAHEPATVKQILLAALLSSCLEEEDVSLTVVGGAAVQFYTQAECVTSDVDMILQGDDASIVKQVMQKLGFQRSGSYRHYQHEFFDFIIEFPPPPLAVASRTLRVVNQIKTEYGTVAILRPEDLIMDRICAAMEWKDKLSFSQAQLLYLKNEALLDKKYLRAFAKAEGYSKILRDVEAILKHNIKT